MHALPREEVPCPLVLLCERYEDRLAARHVPPDLDQPNGTTHDEMAIDDLTAEEGRVPSGRGIVSL